MSKTSGSLVPASSGVPSWRAAWMEYAACAWALLFAAMHIYWALGGTAGLPSGKMVPEAGGALLAIDVAAIPLCIVAGLIALALVQPWGRIIPRWMMLAAAWAAGVAFALRAVVGLLQDGLAVTSGIPLDPMDPYDLWFLLGGILFVVIAWRAVYWGNERSSGHNPLSREASR